MKKTTIAACLATLLLSASSSEAKRIQITSCGTVIENGVGELVGDLDCSGYGGDVAIQFLGKRGTLFMNGHTLTLGDSGAYVGVGFNQIPGNRSRIVGPGSIVGGGYGVYGGLVLRIRDLQVSGARTAGVSGGTTYLRRCRIEDNGFLPDFLLAGGVHGAHVTAYNTLITGNSTVGIAAYGKIRLVRSTVVDNAIGESCVTDPEDCADLLSYGPPRLLRGSVCGTSADFGGADHDICTDD